jgi:hypothetical protein
MDWKKLAWSAVVSTGLVMGSACGDDDTMTDADSGTPEMDGGGPMPMPLDCGDCFFVVNALDFGPGPGGSFPGFNVDGIDAGEDGSGDTDCGGIPDAIGYDGTPGVDNGLGGLLMSASSAGVDVPAEVEAALAEGSVIILVEPSGITSTEQTNVPLRIYLGETASGVAPMVDGMNRISADQVFNYFPEPDIMVMGTISGGILTAGPIDELPLSLSIMGNDVSLVIEDVQIRVDVAQMTEFSGELTPHMLGGKIDLVRLFEALGPLLEGVDVPVSLLETILPAFLDLDPVAEATTITIVPANDGPDGMPGTEDDVAAVTYELEAGECGSISAGLGLEFTTAMKGDEVPAT